MTSGAFARAHADGTILTLRVQPGAKRTGVVGPHGDALKVRVAAPAESGRANEALVSWLATVLGTERRHVRVTVGAHGRTKHVIVEGVEPADVRQRLLPEGT